MKGEILFEKMTDISETYVSEAAIGEVYGNPRCERERGPMSRFFNSGWGVAAVCSIVSLFVIVALVRWGNAGTPVLPSGTPSDTTSPSTSSRFEFSYEFVDGEGNSHATATTEVGDSVNLNATVINRGLPFLYTGSSGDFCPDVRFVHQDGEDSTVLHGGIFLPTDVGTFLVKSGEVGAGTYWVNIPSDAAVGVYDLILSYDNVEQVFPAVLTVEAHKVETDIIQFSFGYEPNVSNTTLPLDFLCLDVWVKNEGSTFTFEGSSMGFIPRAVLRHSESGYTIEGEIDLTTDYTTVTVRPGDIGACTPAFHITPYVPSGVYDLVLSYTLDGQTFEQVFTSVYTLAGNESSPSADTFPLSFGYEPNLNQTSTPGDTITLEVWVKNEGDAFTFEGSSMGFIPAATLRHSESGYVITSAYPQTKDIVLTTVQSGDIGRASPRFSIPWDAPTGVYDLVLTFTLNGRLIERVFPGVQTLTRPQAEPRILLMREIDSDPILNVGQEETLTLTLHNQGDPITVQTNDTTGFILSARLRHSQSGHIIECKPGQTGSTTEKTLQSGQMSTGWAVFDLPSNAPLGLYDCIITYCVNGGTSVNTFSEMVLLVMSSSSISDEDLSLSYDNAFTSTPSVSARGGTISIETTVTNNGAPYTTTLPLGCTAAFLLHSESGYTIEGSCPAAPESNYAYPVHTGDVGAVSFTFHIPADAPEGTYNLRLCYGPVGRALQYGVTVVADMDGIPTLDSTTEARLCDAYETSPTNPLSDYSDISVRRYYGTYASGAIVATISTRSSVTTSSWSEQVGPADIRYPDNQRIEVLYGDRIFLSLQEAFDRGILTAGDLAIIENIHRLYVPSIYSD